MAELKERRAIFPDQTSVFRSDHGTANGCIGRRGVPGSRANHGWIPSKLPTAAIGEVSVRKRMAERVLVAAIDLKCLMFGAADTRELVLRRIAR